MDQSPPRREYFNHMDELKTLLDISGVGLAGASLAVLFYVLKRQKANGNIDNAPALKQLSDELELVKSNHLHTVQESLNRIENKIDEGNRRVEARLIEIGTILKQKNGE